MPNQPRDDNPHRSLRVEDELWHDAFVAARKVGTTRAEVMREALRELVRQAECVRGGDVEKPRRPESLL